MTTSDALHPENSLNPWLLNRADVECFLSDMATYLTRDYAAQEKASSWYASTDWNYPVEMLIFGGARRVLSSKEGTETTHDVDYFARQGLENKAALQAAAFVSEARRAQMDAKQPPQDVVPNRRHIPVRLDNSPGLFYLSLRIGDELERFSSSYVLPGAPEDSRLKIRLASSELDLMMRLNASREKDWHNIWTLCGELGIRRQRRRDFIADVESFWREWRDIMPLKRTADPRPTAPAKIWHAYAGRKTRLSPTEKPK